MNKKTEYEYLALLRGINVGGRNIIKMADLKECFESMKFTKVKTYIQSGNVIFSSTEKNQNILQKLIGDNLSEQFNYTDKVFILSCPQLKNIIEDAPEGFGAEHEIYKYDVMFVKESRNPEEIIKNLKFKEGVDRAWSDRNVIYFSRLISRTSQSYLAKITALPFYKDITIRNWNTTTKLLSLMKQIN